MVKYIGYVRTSTKKQSIGLEEQKAKILEFLKAKDSESIRIIVEQESGKDNLRPGLDNALKLCISENATLLFTKLDRLSREVEFLFSIRNRNVKLHCIDLPELNTLTLGIFGTVAQWERELISQRTKNGLQNLKQRGIQLGKPENFTDEGRKKGNAKRMSDKMNTENWKKAKIFIDLYKASDSSLSFQKLASLLNQHGFRTRHNCNFTATAVQRLEKNFKIKN